MLTAASTEGPARTRPATQWDGILGEFRDWLNEIYGEFLKASLTESAAPRVRHVKLWPRGQRNAQSIMLSVYVTETSARVLGKETPELKTEEDFKQYLAEFVRLPGFHDSLETFKEVASQPVEGLLRVGADRNTAVLADVAVEGPPDQQHRLADASETMPPEHIDRLYVVLPAERVWGGTYNAQTKPIWLLAGGYALLIDDGSDAKELDGRIWLSGTPVPSSKL
jgi:hypothetical protein